MLAWVLLGFCILLVLLLVSTLALHIFVLPAAYVPTPSWVAKEMITLAKLKGDEEVLDLGAGDGQILIEAKKLYPRLRAVGYEIAPLIWLIGWIRTRRYGIQFRLRDANTANVKTTDVVFLYMTTPGMAQFEELFDRDLPKGARVIASGFPFPRRKPVQTVNLSKNPQKTKMLYVYEW